MFDVLTNRVKVMARSKRRRPKRYLRRILLTLVVVIGTIVIGTGGHLLHKYSDALVDANPGWWVPAALHFVAESLESFRNLLVPAVIALIVFASPELGRFVNSQKLFFEPEVDA